MAVRIPVYQDRLTPSGFGVVPQARAQEVSDAVGRGLQNIGEAGTNLAATVMRVDRYNQEVADREAKRQADLAQKKADDDAIAAAGRTLSDAALHWDQYLRDASQNAPDGGAGFTPKVIGEFDKYVETTLGGINNERARQWASSHFNSMRTSLGSKAINFEAQAGVADRDEKLEQTFQNLARLAAQDPSQYEMGRTILLSTIANAGYDPVTRADRAQKYLQRYGEAGLTGATQSNPEGVKTVVDTGYGKDQGPAQGAPQGQAQGASAAVTRNADGTVTLATDPNLPAGMRNNNPGNIIFVGQKDAIGPSVNTDNNGKSRQAVAATPEEGMAAMCRLLLNKFDGGKTTANEMIAGQGGWTPGNPRAAANVANLMGVDPTTKLNLRDPLQLKRFARALMLQEHGPASRQYSDDMVSRVADDVLAGRKVASAPTASRVDPVVSRMAGDVDVGRLPQFASAAQTEINRQMATYRSQLTTIEGDHVSSWMNGDPVQKPLSEVDYVKAYGPLDGPQRYANYQQIAVMGNDMQTLKLATPEQMAATVERYKPQPNTPGYELATKRYDAMVKAAESVTQKRQADPILYAQQNKIGGAGALNFNDQAAFGAEIGKRQGVAATMQQTYQTPYQLLSKTEAQTLSQGFERMTTQQKVGYLETIRRSVPDPMAYRTIMQQVAPDSPVTAMAGMILSKQAEVTRSSWFGMSKEVFPSQDVAAIVLEGEALMNPGKAAKAEGGTGKAFPMPKEQDMRDAFSNQVGKAFASDPNGAAFAFQAVKSYYAGKAARDGDITGALDGGRLKDAITAVIGGVTDINGKGEVIRPWGMDESLFKNAAKAAFDKAIQANGYKGTQLDVWGSYGLQSVGDSKYLARTGTGYLVDKSGRPIVLDLSAPVPAATIIDGRTAQGPVLPARPNTQQPRTR